MCGFIRGNRYVPVFVASHLKSGQQGDDFNISAVFERWIKLDGEALVCMQRSSIDSVFPGPVSRVPRHDREPIAAVIRHYPVAPDADPQSEVFAADVLCGGFDANRSLAGTDVNDPKCGDYVGRTGIGWVEALGDDDIVLIDVAPQSIAPAILGADNR